MEEEIELQIDETGKIITIWDDSVLGLSQDIGATIQKVDRASLVEWEEVDGRRGWTIRAAHDPELAVRGHEGSPYVGREGPLYMNENRGQALLVERYYFWELLERN